MLKCSTRSGMTAVPLHLSSLHSLKFLCRVVLVHLSNVCPKQDCQPQKCYSGTSTLLNPPELCWSRTDLRSIVIKQTKLLQSALTLKATTETNLSYANWRTYSQILSGTPCWSEDFSESDGTGGFSVFFKIWARVRTLEAIEQVIVRRYHWLHCVIWDKLALTAEWGLCGLRHKPFCSELHLECWNLAWG